MKGFEILSIFNTHKRTIHFYKQTKLIIPLEYYKSIQKLPIEDYRDKVKCVINIIGFRN